MNKLAYKLDSMSFSDLISNVNQSLQSHPDVCWATFTESF